jgi:hypothetical protein
MEEAAKRRECVVVSAEDQRQNSEIIIDLSRSRV